MTVLTRFAKIFFLSVAPTMSLASTSPMPGEASCLSGAGSETFDPVPGGYCTVRMDGRDLLNKLKVERDANPWACSDGIVAGGACRTVASSHVPILETGGVFFSALCWKGLGLDAPVESLLLVSSSEEATDFGLPFLVTSGGGASTGGGPGRPDITNGVPIGGGSFSGAPGVGFPGLGGGGGGWSTLPPPLGGFDDDPLGPGPELNADGPPTGDSPDTDLPAVPLPPALALIFLSLGAFAAIGLPRASRRV